MNPELRELPQQLWQHGYRPVPIKRGCKFPVQREWQIKAREDPPWLVTHGLTDEHPYIGIAGDGLRIIDADIDDPERAALFDEFMQRFPKAPLRYREGSPRRVRLFRADEGEPSKVYVLNTQTKERVEVLGKGSQVFAFGTHPESGRTLQWIDGPHEVTRADLPVLTTDEVNRILDFAATLIEADRMTHRADASAGGARPAASYGQHGPNGAPPRQSGGEWPIDDLKSALAAIPNTHADYDQWFKLSCAAYDACGGSEAGYEAWLYWCAHCDDATQSECDKLWTALATSPCYFGAGTLTYHARLHDPFWRRPSQRRPEPELEDGPDHDPDDEPDPPPEKPKFFGVRLRDLSLDVPPRAWIYGRAVIRGMLSVLGGSGGVGKTSYVMQVLISIAADRPFLAACKDDPAHRIFEPRGTVMYYSLEDPMEDLCRQVAAILKYRIYPKEKIGDRLILQSGRDLPLIVAKQNDKGKMERCDIRPIVQYLLDNEVDVLVVDPFANSFDGGEGTESGADTMKIICDQWRLVAHYANCAVWLLHHFRKGGLAGEADAFRGSTTIQNAARIMETMTTMTKEEAEQLGVPADERRQYMRLENAKLNLGPASEGCWFRFVGVPLGNGTDKYPQGDVIGVVTQWTPRPIELSWNQIETTLNAVEAGCENGTEFYSSKPNSSRPAWEVITACTGLNKVQAKAQLDEWLQLGVLKKGSYRSKNRKDTERLIVDQEAKIRFQGVRD